MKIHPSSIGPLHFVGIGGIGMSGIAEILHNLGYTVQGSDLSDNYNTKRLAQLGIKIHVGHVAENVKEAHVVVISSAVKPSNPEVIEARARHIPVIKRAEMLAELMRLKSSIAIGGTHGKTTTTSLVGAILKQADLDPTIINGGIINALKTNACLGQGDWMVVESDESDGSFTKLPATHVVVTNIDPEHLEHYGSYEALCASFVQFIEQIPFYGCAVVCLDHPKIQEIAPQILDRRVMTYGFHPAADVRAENIIPTDQGMIFDVVFGARCKQGEERITGFSLPMFGPHNVQNALSAITIATEMGISMEIIQKALGGFSGVKRRFTQTGVVNGVTIIDDYGHHPVEIMAVLKAARQVAKNKIIAVMQPHRYTRLSDLFDQFCGCFGQADIVVISEVYAAGEDPIEGASQEKLIEGVKAQGHKHVYALKDPKDLHFMISELAANGDYVVCLGAGTVTQWANDLPQQLKQMKIAS